MYQRSILPDLEYRLRHLDIVYTLAYPDIFVTLDGENLSAIVFYVGHGHRDRLVAHEQEARTACQCEKCMVIRSIWDAGLMVQRCIQAEGLTNEEGMELEREFIITRFSSQHLVNVQHNRYRRRKRVS